MTRDQLLLLVEARAAASDGTGSEIRRQAGLSQSQLAQAIGVRPSAVCRWENQVRKPSGDAALRYGRVLRLLREKEAP
jgi:DNA-binding transcriptional regulator YiaG